MIHIWLLFVLIFTKRWISFLRILHETSGLNWTDRTQNEIDSTAKTWNNSWMFVMHCWKGEFMYIYFAHECNSYLCLIIIRLVKSFIPPHWIRRKIRFGNKSRQKEVCSVWIIILSTKKSKGFTILRINLSLVWPIFLLLNNPSTSRRNFWNGTTHWEGKTVNYGNSSQLILFIPVHVMRWTTSKGSLTTKINTSQLKGNNLVFYQCSLLNKNQ